DESRAGFESRRVVAIPGTQHGRRHDRQLLADGGQCLGGIRNVACFNDVTSDDDEIDVLPAGSQMANDGGKPFLGFFRSVEVRVGEMRDHEPRRFLLHAAQRNPGLVIHGCGHMLNPFGALMTNPTADELAASDPRHDFVSPDGSPLALYLAIPAGDAPTIVHQAVPPASSILELGSGPGRLTRVLVAYGHTVTAVDDSREMLEHVTGARRVCADLHELDLGERFDVVLGASHLINEPKPATRRRLLQVCRRHVAEDGVVLLERYPPGWCATARGGSRQFGPGRMVPEAGALVDGDCSAATTSHVGTE